MGKSSRSMSAMQHQRQGTLLLPWRHTIRSGCGTKWSKVVNTTIFGQMALLPVLHSRDHNGPVCGPFWPKEVYFGAFRSANRTLATLLFNCFKIFVALKVVFYLARLSCRTCETSILVPYCWIAMIGLGFHFTTLFSVEDTFCEIISRLISQESLVELFCEQFCPLMSVTRKRGYN